MGLETGTYASALELTQPDTVPGTQTHSRANSWIVSQTALHYPVHCSLFKGPKIGFPGPTKVYPLTLRKPRGRIERGRGGRAWFVGFVEINVHKETESSETCKGY